MSGAVAFRRSHGALVAGLGVLLVVVAAGCASPSAAAPATPVRRTDGVGAIVLVSGRDDHGLLRDHEVPLFAAPDVEQVRPIARVHDGRLARVVAVHGTWLRIRTVGTPELEGWLDDFYLRDRALRTDVGEQVTFVDVRADERGAAEAAVRPTTAPAVEPVWVSADVLQEVGLDSSADGHQR